MSSATPLSIEKLLTQSELLGEEALRNVSSDKFGRLRRLGLIPYIKLGHKTYLYQKTRVMEALAKLEGGARK